MNQNLSEVQATQRNVEDYVDKYSTLDRAAVSVIMTHTREPYRAIQALRDYAAALNRPFRVWSMSQGWATYTSSDPGCAPTTDNTIDPIAALRKVGDSTEFEDRSISVMIYPHKPIQAAFLFVQLLKEYARVLGKAHRRLVLLVPPSFQLPEELQDDIVVLDFDAPSYAELRENYGFMLESIRDESMRPTFTDEQIDQIVAAGAGMTSDEFDNALARALIEQRPNLPNVSIDDFLGVIMRAKTEVVKRSEVLEVMEPGSLDEIGGLENLKDWIAKRAQCFGQEARDFGIEPPKGCALIGPPGTGKSLAAKAIASALHVPALRFDVGRVFNSLVGQSEARVREALKLVDAMAPCVLMIDEADKAFAGQAGGGSSGDSGVGMRVLGAILTWMQETKSPVFVVVTANRVQNLPTEFLRRGRLDEIFSVTTPTDEERLEILNIHLRKRGKDPKKIKDLNVAVDKSAGYVAAELEAAVKDAIIDSFVDKTPLTGDLIVTQLGCMVPISEAFKEDFANMEEWATNNARPASKGRSMPRTRTRSKPTAAPVLGRSRAAEFSDGGLDG